MINDIFHCTIISDNSVKIVKNTIFFKINSHCLIKLKKKFQKMLFFYRMFGQIFHVEVLDPYLLRPYFSISANATTIIAYNI